MCVAPAAALHLVPARVWGRIATFMFGAVLWGHQFLYLFVVTVVFPRVPDLGELLDPRKWVAAA